MLTLVSGPAVTVTGSITTDSATVTVPSTAAMAGALAVSGTGIPPGAMVKSIDSATTLTLTANATATNATASLTFGIEVVTLAQAKKHLKIDADLTEDDDLIAELITAAREKCETEVWQCFLTSTWDYALDEFPWGSYDWRTGPGDRIKIPNPPLVSVTSISYLDAVGSTVALSGSLYAASAGTPGIIYPAYNTTWPYSNRYQPNGVVVRYVAGYGLASAVPASVKAAIKLHLAALYYNRGDADVPLSGTVLALLARVQHGAIA